MMNAVGGTTLHYWAQSWRLNPWDFKVVSETTRRYGASRIPKGSTVEDWPFGSTSSSRTTTRSSTRSACPGRPATSTGRSIRAATSSRAPRAARLPDAAAARHRASSTRWPRRRRRLGWHPFPGPAAINSRALPGPLGVHVSRLLQPRRLPRRREELDRGHDDSARAGDRPLRSSPRARDDDRGRRQRPRHRRHLRHRRRRSTSSRRRSCCSRATPTRTRGCCCCRSRRRSPTACRTITARSAATTSATHQAAA